MRSRIVIPIDYQRKRLAKQGLSSDQVLEKLSQMSDQDIWEQLKHVDSSEQRLIFAHRAFFSQGQQVFALSEALQEMFAETSLASVTIDEVKFPYPIFYVAFQGERFKVLSDNVLYHVRGVYVCTRQILFPEFYVNLQKFMAMKDELAQSIEPFTIPCGENDTLQVDFSKPIREEDINVVNFIFWGTGPEEDDEYRPNVSFPLHDESVTYLEDNISRMEKSKEGELAFFEGTEENGLLPYSKKMDKEYAENKRIHGQIFRIVFNLLIYLNSEKPIIEVVDNSKRKAAIEKALKQKPKKAVLLRKLQKASGTTITYVAPGIKMQDKSGESGSQTARRRHKVRGHWHSFWTGPRNNPANRTKIRRWVEPYWRGESLAGTVEKRIYQVQKPTNNRS